MVSLEPITIDESSFSDVYVVYPEQTIWSDYFRKQHQLYSKRVALRNCLPKLPAKSLTCYALFNMTKSFKINDPQRVIQHYKTKDNLDIRIRTHEQYTQPKIDFISWVLDQSRWLGLETVLDIGSGSGNYVNAVQKRTRSYIAGDMSAGMLATIAGDISRIQLDAQQLPLSQASVDVVLANHMLYHVPNLDECLRQVQRVLRAGGRLIAATNSRNNMAELRHLIMDIGRKDDKSLTLSVEQLNLVTGFNLENGQALLQPFFSKVDRFELNSALVFPSAEPVLAYMGSMQEYYMSFLPIEANWDDIVVQLRQRLQSHLGQNEAYRVNKKMGVFICYP